MQWKHRLRIMFVVFLSLFDFLETQEYIRTADRHVQTSLKNNSRTSEKEKTKTPTLTSRDFLRSASQNLERSPKNPGGPHHVL